MRLLLALCLVLEPALAAAAGSGRSVSVTGRAAPLAALPDLSGLRGLPPLPSVPVLPDAGQAVHPGLAVPGPSAVPVAPAGVPAVASAPAAGPEARGEAAARPLAARLDDAASGAVATAAGLSAAPAEAAGVAGERDFALLLGAAPPSAAQDAPVVADGGGSGSGPVLAPPSGGPRDPKRSAVRRMFAGTMAFKVGMEAMTTSIPFIAMKSLGGATAVALLVVVTYGLGQAAFGSLAGALTDRFRASRVLSAAVLAQGVVVGGVLALSLAGALQAWMLFPLYAVVGGAVGIAETSRRVIPALILGRDQEALRRYNARLHRFYEIAGVAGSALAGLLIWKAGAVNALLVTPPAALIGWLLFRGVLHEAASQPESALVRGPAARSVKEALRRYLADLRLGLSTVVRDPRLRWVTLAMVLPQIVHRIFENMLLPVFAKGVLGHEALSAVLLTSSNLGELIGASLLLRWSSRNPGPHRWVRWGAYGLLGLWALSAASLLHLPAGASLLLLLPAVLLSSTTWSASHLSLETEVQERVPGQVQPRVFSVLYGAFVVGAAAASYLIGRFLDAVSLSAGFLALNAVLAGLALLVWYAARRLRPAPPKSAP